MARHLATPGLHWRRERFECDQRW